jgi:Ni,Fe-hydrogenase III large subunit/Ni,Fe-hydrogenase III component G
MRLCGIDAPFERFPAPLPMWRAKISREQWLSAAVAVKDGGGRLLSLWGADYRSMDGSFAISVAYVVGEGLVWLILPLVADMPYPDLSAVFPAAARMQRAVADLLGLQAGGASDTRPWLRHDAWPADYFPLRQQADGHEQFPDQAAEPYAFVRVEGDGVHEIAVGPVHAGIIEPGHFRFSVVGEKVLRLEERLGYTHRGIEKQFGHTAPLEGHRLAGRISGDSTVAYAWAYCMALESIGQSEIPTCAQWTRALLLERERVANHLGDLGALGNDAGFSFGLSQFSMLKENCLRLNQRSFGHRLMMDCIVPGGSTVVIKPRMLEALALQCEELAYEVSQLQLIYEEHAGLQDRFIQAGRVRPALAAELGLCGLAGRASGQAMDLRADQPWTPYAELEVKMATHRNGDVAARVIVRFEEVFESLRLIREICERLGSMQVEPNRPPVHLHGCGMGWVEGWRGEVLIALDVREGRILRCHAHDPSWHNWPLLEHAIIGNIVPDFPLINKSFNLSYAGHDL